MGREKRSGGASAESPSPRPSPFKGEGEGIAGIDLEALAAAVAAGLGMAIDVRKLRHGELVQVLNSTPLGVVVDEGTIRRHRAAVGLRIGDGRTIDLLRYTAWLAIERHKPGLSGYEAHKERQRQRQAEQSSSGRDIGEIPPVVSPERRAACGKNLPQFLKTYFPKTFTLPWSFDHQQVLRVIERAVRHGGLFAEAMPRGFGKTAIAEGATTWAVLYTHRRFAAVVGPDEDHARQRIENIQTELEHNDLLLEDFPEVCHPIRRLEGINQRRLLHRGKPVLMEFGANRIILPQIEGSAAGGSIIATAGITGQIRGLNVKRADGTALRPDLVLLDDPQTDESAHSPSQCERRERIINGAVLGLGGPGATIAAVLACTVVRPGDLADTLLDRNKNPQWQGERTKMVYAWPTAEALWRKYAEMRRDAQRLQTPPEEATRFYRVNRAKMDDGAKVAWEERYNPGELSAIQHAWNIRLDRGDRAFFAEYQNDPLPDAPADEALLDASQIAEKTSGLARGLAPGGCHHLTAFIDVQARLLYWMVAGWEEDFTGQVIDYGTEPDQKTDYFALRDARRTLAAAAPRAGLEGAIFAGLGRLAERLLSKEWRRDDGARMRIERCLVDANWGQSTDVIYQFCRGSPHAAVLTPSHGRYVGASSIPFADYRPKRGDRVGLNWRVPLVTGKRAVRHVVIDTNYWKSFVHARLAVPAGDPGCLSLFGRTAVTHRMLAEHLTAEYRVQTTGRGRTVDEWKLRAEGLDNHWLDCLVGCAVAASMQGALLEGTGERPAARRRIKLSELQRQRRMRSA